MSEERTAITLAYDYVLGQIEEEVSRDGDEIWQVLKEAMDAQMVRWSVIDDPLPYLEKQLTEQSLNREQMPAEDADDLLLYFLGFAHGLMQAIPLRTLTSEEGKQLYVFLCKLLGLDE